MSWPSGVQQITTLNGNELIDVANQSPIKLEATIASITAFSGPQVYTNAQTTAATLTALQMAGNPSNASITGPPSQVFMYCTGSTGGSVTFTTPTVAQMIAAFPNWNIGTSFEFDVINAGTGNNVVLAGGTGWTLSGGSATVANNVWRKYFVTLVSAIAITAVGIEVGSYS